MTWRLLEWAHVAAVVVALGGNVACVAAARSVGGDGPEPQLLRALAAIENVANPAYLLALFTGGALAWYIHLPLTTPWVLGSLILYGLLWVVGVTRVVPKLRPLARGPTPADPRAALREVARWWTVQLGLACAILFLMIVKPA